MWEDLSGAAGVTVSMLVGTVGGVQLAGFYPPSARPPALAGFAGRLMIATFAATLAVLFISAVWRGWVSPAWPASVIGTGLAILGGPLLFQAIPRRVRDGRASVLLMSAVNLGLIVILSGPYLGR